MTGDEYVCGNKKGTECIRLVGVSVSEKRFREPREDLVGVSLERVCVSLGVEVFRASWCCLLLVRGVVN